MNPVNHPTQTFYKNAYLYFILAMAITLFAFMPSYFTRLGKTDGAHHFHGITATLWMLLLIVQPLLYKLKRFTWHRNVGKLSFVLVPLIIVGGLKMVSTMIMGQEHYPPDVVYQLAFIDFVTLSLFLLYFVLAIVHRKNVQLHARYMVCTVLGPLLPAVTRLLFIFPTVTTFHQSLNISYLLIEFTLFLLLLHDKRSGKIYVPYVAAMVAFLVQHVLMNFASGWLWWRKSMDLFAQWF